MATSQPDHSLDGQSQSELLMGLSISMVVICTLVVGARIYTRAIMLNNAGLDDVMIVITQVCMHEICNSPGPRGPRHEMCEC